MLNSSMNNRICAKFLELKKIKKPAFIAFLTAGDPTLSVTEELVCSLADSGVDIVELGVPFSDPLADGPTIQAASQRALKNHVTLHKILQSVKRIRRYSQIPIALMTYCNPVFRFGEEKFVVAAREAGVDGVIIPDLPVSEAQTFIKAARASDVATIFFVSPTTTLIRMQTIVRASTGFVYYVSLTGVTGTRGSLPKTIVQNVELVKKHTAQPICVGFGISTPEQIHEIGRTADGVIVGSAIVKEIEKNKGRPDLVKRVSAFVRRLTAAL